MKITIGSRIPDFNVDTVTKNGVTLKELVGEKKTALYFLRYAGCSLCQLDMIMLEEEYTKLEKFGGKAIVVLQSDAEKLKDTNFSYDIICNPDQSLYKELEIHAAHSIKELVGEKSKAKIEKVKERGLEHGDYEGEELQLPAVFIVDADLSVTYAKYGKDAIDIPDIDEVCHLMMN